MVTVSRIHQLEYEDEKSNFDGSMGRSDRQEDEDSMFQTLSACLVRRVGSSPTHPLTHTHYSLVSHERILVDSRTISFGLNACNVADLQRRSWSTVEYLEGSTMMQPILVSLPRIIWPKELESDGRKDNRKLVLLNVDGAVCSLTSIGSRFRFSRYHAPSVMWKLLRIDSVHPKHDVRLPGSRWFDCTIKFMRNKEARHRSSHLRDGRHSYTYLVLSCFDLIRLACFCTVIWCEMGWAEEWSGSWHSALAPSMKIFRLPRPP
jgi:hypothetical protein